MLRHRRGRPGRSAAPLLVALVFAGVFGSGLTPLAAPGIAQASQTVGPAAEDQMLTLINNARVSNGLRPLRLDTRLRSLAEYRAGVMASTMTMSHTVAGNLGSELTSRGIQYYSWGECIGWSTYAYPTTAINYIFKLMHDAVHWAILMSAKFNYIGVGVVHRSDNNSTWVSIVETESADHTAPWAKITSSSRSGSTVTWHLSGGETWLQSHNSFWMNFDVEYRVGSGSWQVIRSGTTATTISLTNRPSGHYYGLRIRSRDHAGNVSAWTGEVRVWVP